MQNTKNNHLFNLFLFQYDLVCDDAILVKVSQSIFFTGILVGSLTSGQLSDIFGRKPVIFVSLIGEALSGLGTALVWNYYAFVFFWFLLGFFEQVRKLSWIWLWREKFTLLPQCCCYLTLKPSKMLSLNDSKLLSSKDSKMLFSKESKILSSLIIVNWYLLKTTKCYHLKIVRCYLVKSTMISSKDNEMP